MQEAGSPLTLNKVGETLWWDSFVSPDTFGPVGRVYLGESVDPPLDRLKRLGEGMDEDALGFELRGGFYIDGKLVLKGGIFDPKSTYEGNKGRSFTASCFAGNTCWFEISATFSRATTQPCSAFPSTSSSESRALCKLQAFPVLPGQRGKALPSAIRPSTARSRTKPQGASTASGLYPRRRGKRQPRPERRGRHEKRNAGRDRNMA